MNKRRFRIDSLLTPNGALGLIAALSLLVGLSWLFGSILSRSDRAQFVDQAAVAANLLAFGATTIALLAAAYQLRLLREVPLVTVRARNPAAAIAFALRGEGGVTPEKNSFGNGIMLGNHGPGPVRIDRVTVSSAVVDRNTGSWIRDLFEAETFPWVFPPTGGPMDFDFKWEALQPALWELQRTITVSEGAWQELPSIHLRISDSDRAIPLIEAGTLLWTLWFRVYTDRGVVPSVVEIPITAQHLRKVDPPPATLNP